MRNIHFVLVGEGGTVVDKQTTWSSVADSWQPELVLTLEQIENFVAHLREKKYIQGTVNRYEWDLKQFYAAHNNVYQGPIFLSRDGKTMECSNITQRIHRICIASGVPEEKVTRACLKKLYQTTQAGIEANFDLLVEQAMEHQLEKEQKSADWKESGEHALQHYRFKMRLRRGSYAESTGSFRSHGDLW